MWPYANTELPQIAVKQGWFDDVGISIVPASGETLPGGTQTYSQLLNGQLDMASDSTPSHIPIGIHEPQLKTTMMTDWSIGGQNLLASPQSGAKPVSYFVERGQSFNQAMHSAMGQLKGKPVAFTNFTGKGPFEANIMQLGGVKPTDFALSVLPDETIVQLGKAGKIDFAHPEGFAQEVELISVGWYPIVALLDLAKYLPPRSPEVLLGLADGSIGSNVNYVNKNMETVLRFHSVVYRTIDAVKRSPEILSVYVPSLSAVLATTITLADAQVLFTGSAKTPPFFELQDFEQQATQLLDTNSQYYFGTVYGLQIEAAKKGGVIPAGATLTVEDLTMDKALYLAALDLKHRYDTLRASGRKLASNLSAQAETQYVNRNYLDAYRLLRAAAS